MNVGGQFSGQPYNPDMEFDTFHFKDPRTKQNYKIEVYGINRNDLYRIDELKNYKVNKKDLHELQSSGIIREKQFIKEKQDILARSIFAHVRDKISTQNEVKIGDGDLLNNILEPMDLNKLEKGVLIRIKVISTKTLPEKTMSTPSNIPHPLPPKSKKLEERVLKKLVEHQNTEEEKKYNTASTKHLPQSESAPTSPRPPRLPPRFHSVPTSPRQMRTGPPPLPLTTPKPFPSQKAENIDHPELPNREPAKELFKKVTQQKAETFAARREILEMGQNSFPLPGLKGEYVVTTTHLPSLTTEQKSLLKNHIDKLFYERLVKNPGKDVHLTLGSGLEEALSKIGIHEFHKEIVIDIKIMKAHEPVRETPKPTRPLPAQPKLDHLAEALKLSAERRMKENKKNQK